MITSFVNNESSEPLAKKIKTSPQCPDDSLKFFKTIKTRSTRTVTSSVTNVATSFIDESSRKTSIPPQTKPIEKAFKKKSKGQPDIRKVLSKQEQTFQQVIDENCYEAGVDPEEMQLALAISNSLKDSNLSPESEASNNSSMKFENPFSSTGKVQSISSVLEKFGFKSKTYYTEYELDLLANKKISKRSKYQKLPTPLTRISNEKRQENINNRISELLERNLNVSILEVSDSNTDFPIFSPVLKEAHIRNRRLFTINSEDRPTDNILFDYYVADLFEPSTVPADHLLKDWSKVPGRDPTPERVISHKETNASQDTRSGKSGHSECGGTNKVKEVQEMMESVDTKEEILRDDKVVSSHDDDNNSTASCSDIFAGFECSDNEVEEVKTDIADLSQKLGMLQEKFSQSLVEIKNAPEIHIDESLSEISDENCKQETYETVGYKKKIESVDLTHGDSSVDSNFTIPYDDSYYSLQAHIKNIFKQKLSSEEEAKGSEQVNLTSTDEDETLPVKTQYNGKSMIEENDEIEMSYQCSQNSFEDDSEIIAISDEEINYSVQKFHSNNESASDRSIEFEGKTIDLTQENFENSEKEPPIEVSNILEQSLADVLNHQEDINIDDTINNLLETTRLTVLNETKSRATKDSERSWMSDSIKQIMSKYGKNSPGADKILSFKKTQSESMLSSIVNNQDEADENMSDLTQPRQPNESWKENLHYSLSFHQSLENLSNHTPVVNKEKLLKKSTFRKKSVGFQIEENYRVDLESTTVEPDFKNMTPVELKQALFKFGVRSLPVKKAVSLLEFIYNQIHPTIQAAADEEIDANDSRRGMNYTDIVTNIGILDSDDFVFQVDILDDEEVVLPKVRKSKVI